MRVSLGSAGGHLGQKMLEPAGMHRQLHARGSAQRRWFRCVALAAFLAELATEDSGSGLVFDDPVSSLDHHWKRRMAERLLELAASRQVVVFTHDIAFASDLVRDSDIGQRVHVGAPRDLGNASMACHGKPWE